MVDIEPGLHEYKGHPVFRIPSQPVQKLLCTGELSCNRLWLADCSYIADLAKMASDSVKSIGKAATNQ